MQLIIVFGEIICMQDHSVDEFLRDPLLAFSYKAVLFIQTQ